jgi:integrase
MPRRKTKYPNIYSNSDTGKYDVKYNYKVYNASKQKNEYKQKWIYNIATLADARNQLSLLQTQGAVKDNKDITLQGIYDLWKAKADAQKFSPVTIRNTTQHMKMIYQFLPKETKLKNITEDVYYKFASDCRNYGYSDETLHSINATFRKMINLAYKKKLITENVLDYCDNIKTKQKEEYQLVSKEDFDKIDEYLKNHSFWRLGVNCYPKYRLLVNILYYTGMRIGEVLALTYNDFEVFSYYKKEEEPLRIAPSDVKETDRHLQGMRVNVVKAYVSDMHITKDPKNLKKRSIPLSPAPERLYMRIKEEHKMSGGSMDDKIFSQSHGAVNVMIGNVCKKLNLTVEYNCHDFRHTFISNLISKGVPLPVIEKVSGDTQQMILKRYSHMFESDEMLVLLALQNL